MILPNWFVGQLGSYWWPDRPREPMVFVQNAIPVNAGQTVTVELYLARRTDVLVFGGVALVTSTDNQTVHCPASGIWSQILSRLYNPAGNESYSDAFTAPATKTAPPLIPLENLLSAWQNPAQDAAYWPVPIPVRQGATLLLQLQNIGAGNKNVRLGFWSAQLYARERAA